MVDDVAWIGAARATGRRARVLLLELGHRGAGAFGGQRRQRQQQDGDDREDPYALMP
jgi:hypothetical protein